MAKEPIIIVGGGLSGLYAALLLEERGLPWLLLEARPQLGGRIQTHYHEGHAFDLGPSWFWPALNPRMAQLVTRLALDHYPQHTTGDAWEEDADGTLQRLPHHEADDRSPRRLTGGTQRLIDALASVLPEDAIQTDCSVTAIHRQQDEILITAASESFQASSVILALPPRLLAATVSFLPQLPEPALRAFSATLTWMAGDAKFFALYNQPFWRSEGLSGSLFSECGPLSEFHDAALPDGPAALLGFVVPNRQQRLAMGEAELISKCLAQITKALGPRATDPITAFVQDWSTEPLTSTPTDVPLFEHPTYGLPAVTQGLWEGRLHFAGTEAAPEHGGYMEGALEAAENVIARLG